MPEEPQSSKQHAMENEQQSKRLLHGSGTVEGNRTLDEPQCSKSRRARSSRAKENEQQSKRLLHGSGTVEGNRTLDEPQSSKQQSNGE